MRKLIHVALIGAMFGAAAAGAQTPADQAQNKAVIRAHDTHDMSRAVAASLKPLKAPADARVFIISPKDGAKVGRDVKVEFGVQGITLKPASEGDTSPNSGHHHLLIDVDKLPPLDRPVPADEYHKHYGNAQTGDVLHLSPGTHTLQLDFADARHMQFDPPIVSKKITIHVK